MKGKKVLEYIRFSSNKIVWLDIENAFLKQPKYANPFGLCQRTCDFNPENCGHCTEPLQCGEWSGFWERLEQDWAEHEKKLLYYDPWPDCPSGGCGECEDTNCAQRAAWEEDKEGECDYTGDACIDTSCRDIENCLGCEVIAPPPKEALEEEAC